jgi:dihydroorotate dehydrogenase
VALEVGLDGIVATNTTLSREGLVSPDRDKAGGLSGAPLFERSTRVLARLHRQTGGRMPLIGVGGVDGPDAAWAKIRAGASAVQLYTALAYQGLGLVPRILDGLAGRLAARGFASVADAVGTGRGEWL